MKVLGCVDQCKKRGDGDGGGLTMEKWFQCEVAEALENDH